MIPDFTKYSLAFLEGDRLIYSACGGGLRPLWDGLEKFQEKTGLILHDKVTGLAAARLIVQSGIIDKIFTMVASLPAREFLQNNGIALNAFEVTAHILTQDKSAVCPGEVIALSNAGSDEFTQNIKVLLGVSKLNG